MMNWQVGQQVRCDRQDQSGHDGKVAVNEGGSIIISCPDRNMIVVGSEESLKRLGWRLVK
ncbi:hypothetical protein [Trichothermofontia sp.]